MAMNLPKESKIVKIAERYIAVCKHLDLYVPMRSTELRLFTTLG
jgi:hypothetical protein